ncbi:putative protein-serine/threonine phosphatase [Helianthus annuus]|nr:putative protein-serine/threonine phosphatase [Helianthus annuus]
MKGYFLPLSLSLSLEHTVFSCLLNVYVVKVMIGDGDDACFCMDYFPNIIIGLVRSGPYLGGATRMVCEMQPVLQPWWIGQNSATTIINLRSYNPHEGVDSEKKEQLACNLHTFSSNSNTKPNFLSVLLLCPLWLLKNLTFYWPNKSNKQLMKLLKDASRAIDIDPKYSKGYSRRGAAYLSMGSLKMHLRIFKNESCRI